MTLFFIILVTLFIIGYDIVLAIKKKKTITKVIRHLYVTFVFFPFSVGVIALGHFLDLIRIRNDVPWVVGGLGISGAIMLAISIYMTKKEVELKKWQPIIFLALGYLIGDIFF